jgi:NAD(P)-dependent dehydrogenase (short-subunit alcohol dehydrogenase family)
MFSLEGKKALVTGASRGIGRAIAEALADAGADVALLSRSKDTLDEVAQGILAKGRKAPVVPCDVLDEEQVEAAYSQAVSELGGLDILVNNAGGNRFLALVPDMRPDGWDKLISWNLRSVFLFSRLAGQHMRENGGGSIVNLSSVAGVSAAPGLAAYSAAKHGVIGLTKSMAVELAHANIRVNAIAPGWIRTDLNENFRADENAAQAFVDQVPMKRWGEAPEIAGAAVFLASDAASYITGTTLLIDGGLTAT